MRKSIGALLGMVAVLSACGAPKLVGAPAPAGAVATASRGSDMDEARRLFDTLRAFFKVEPPSSMSLSSRPYGPGWGFCTLSPHNADPSLYQVYAGTITKAGKITTLIDFAGSYRVSRSAEMDKARAAIRNHVTTQCGTQIKTLIIGKTPKGFDKYAYLAIGSNTTDPDPDWQDLTWFHTGTYSVKGGKVDPITDFGTKPVPGGSNLPAFLN
jgi:hypothetical protein